ncbi:hypothetical protein [Asaia bogorensis]|uniref:Uncharacterized protein n=1 Tax=Asaia bogorensis NBRC 16594 TaxID=1231624 RepID=A0AAN4R4K5_9PROT|nr:hypothetical protein [Asaia bogorensis]BAT19848.1 hypothetical protein Asbog_01575 [Asaia bogorensis NBRC 16594]GBQ77482.1 hypothetical protein AA0311_1456 [Asaia bogorensis NBRC 16594]GEL54307.1 hypothetical protein ABO01nite_23140 [Asaia bogorensis NBRC 16594]
MSPPGDFITRGEFSEVKAELKEVVLDVHSLRAAQTASNAKLDKILAQVIRQGSIKAWVGWAIVTATSAAVATVLTHIPMGHP